MGMAAYGDSQKYLNSLSPLLYFDHESERLVQDQSIYDMSLHSSAYEAHCNFAKIFELIGIAPINTQNPEFTQAHFDLAASVQKVFESVLISLVTFYSEKTNNNNICLSGGTALNSLANMKLRNLGFNLFVQPASSDRGLSIGSSFYLASELGEHIAPPANMYLGNCYSDTDIESVTSP